jgi:hypothetical protein
MGERCPGGCGNAVEAGKVMCMACWSRVPRQLQQKVFRASRALRNGPRAEAAGLRYDLDTARDDAIASVR